MVGISEKFLFKEKKGNLLYYSERGIMDYFYKVISNGEDGVSEFKNYLEVAQSEKDKINKGVAILGRRDSC